MFQSQIAFFTFNCLLFQSILLFCDCYIKVINNALVTVILELLTALLECLYFDQFVQCTAEKASLLHQNASVIPDSFTYLYYAQNYAGIITSSLIEFEVLHQLGIPAGQQKHK